MPFLSQLADFDASSLDLLQRILLISDGTLTETLEAAFLEPIGLQKLALNVRPAPNPIEALDVASGEPLMERKILLCGAVSRRRYVYAESQLALDRLSPELRQELIQTETPMGRLWSKHRLETWKELLSVSRQPMGELAAHFDTAEETVCLARRYRVISGGRPLMLIAEHFPESYRLD